MTVVIKVCHWQACKKNNSKYTLQRANNALNLPEDEWWTVDNGEVTVEKWSCRWLCDKWPIVEIGEWEKKKNIHNYVNSAKMWDLVAPFKKHKNKKKIKDSSLKPESDWE